MALTVRQRATERAKARKFWNSLSSSDRWAIGDQLVTGDFDWMDWFNSPPSHTFLDELDELRIDWETGQ